MSGKRYSDEFKVEAAKQVIDQGRSGPEATIALGEHLTAAGALALAIACRPDQRIELCRLCCGSTTRHAAARRGTSTA
jgi:hypothetical protein